MAWHFDGDNHYVEVADHAALTLPAAGWTLGGWLRRGSGAAATYRPLVGWSTLGANPSAVILAMPETWPVANIVIPFLCDGDTTVLSRATVDPVQDDQWHHLAIQYASTHEILWFDGVQQDNHAVSGFDDVNPAASWYFGKGEAEPDYWIGDMAEWAKWDRVLSPVEIAALAGGAVPRGIPTGLAWHFSMLDYGESVAGLSIANHGSTLVDHPATVVTSARPYRVDGAELFCPDAVAAEVFITGIMAGQVNEC